MAAAATSVARLALPVLRADERRLVATAGLVFALASAGAAMSAAAADAMFLAEIGPRHLGGAVAASSALLAVVLAIVGGLADRLERRRVLAALSIASAAVLIILVALSAVAPAATAIATLIGGKQLAAATDLAFWVVIAERLDARRSQRLLPMLAATGGAGAALGAVLVIPLAPAIGARGVLACAALLLVLAGLVAARLPATGRVGTANSGNLAGRPSLGWAPGVAGLIARSWRDGARAVRRHPLAQHLAIVVGAAGVFASLAYFALGVAVADRGGSTAELAALLGAVRGAGQLVTLIVQLAIASRLIARLGTGRALLLAPFVALAAGLGLVVAPILAVAIATQLSTRVLDGAIETPAEKLAQTLLPTAVRGRIAGFLDGTAKRAGAVLGGLVAAALAGAPTAFYITAAIAAALWLVAALRIARELPALAVAHVAREPDDVAMVDERAFAALLGELAGPRPERAAEVLARLGRADGNAARGGEAIAPLVRAVTKHDHAALWRALTALCDGPAREHGAALLAAARASQHRELALRAVGLAGGVPTDALTEWLSDRDAAVALTAAVAQLRLAGDDPVPALGDALRGGVARTAIVELVVEVARADDRSLEAARHLSRALHRGRGDAASRATAYGALGRVVAVVRDRRSAELALLRADLLELARERVKLGASEVAPPEALTSLMRPTKSIDDAPETAAALRLYGELLDGADAVEPDDLRRIAQALGEPDDDVRAAAEAALRNLGPVATGELIATAAWGRRRARDRAAALLHDLPVTAATIDRLIDAELDALDQTHVALAVMHGDELLARRLDERLAEIAHTVLLLVAARRRSRAIAQAALAWRHARGGLERARTLAVIEAALPRTLVRRLVEAVDELTPADRAAALARAGITPPTRDAALRAELVGRDRLARALALHALGAGGLHAHRDTIAQAAHAEVSAASPGELLRRLTEALDDEPIHEGASDMPSRVETLIVLSKVPLFAALTTRQLADVAERARWVTAAAGAVVLTGGDVIDALVVVDEGELAIGDRRITKGEVVDELACVAPLPLAADLRAVRATRLIRLERVDFEELVDDVPGLAAAVCRALGDRARRAEDAGYRSPLTSKGSASP